MEEGKDGVVSAGRQPVRKRSDGSLKRHDSLSILASRLMWTTTQEETLHDPFLQNMLGEQEHVKSSARPARVSTASNSSLISDVDTEAEFQLSEFEDDSTWEKEDKLEDGSGFVVDPDGDLCYLWLGIVTISVLYNLWAVIYRTAFKDDLGSHLDVFVLFDWLADFIYLADIAVQFHVGYLEQGILVQNTKKLRYHYSQDPNFYKDILSVFPVFILEFLYWPFAELPLVILRFPRFLKISSLVKFFDMSDTHTSLPHLVRALRLTLYFTTAIHWLACCYYMISHYEGFGTNDWVYPRLEGQDATLTRKYIRSLYWSMLTLTAIGETPNPSTNLEYVVTGLTYIVGVMVFAAVVGNVGDVISNMNAARMDFQARYFRQMDCIKQYMNHRSVPELLQRRVKKWLDYSWSRTQALDEASLLALLPGQLRTEIAIHVHLDTLKKVDIFANCERGFLRELVVKLRSQIFSPGDYICREGEVGREMYIINHGRVEVIVREQETNHRIVVRTMTEGSYFGEISLLRLDAGCNKRSADVRSVGYSELFILSKRDLLQALHYYPEAKELLEKGGRDRLKDHRTHVDSTSPSMGEEDFDLPKLFESAPPLTSKRSSNTSEEMKILLRELRQFDSLASRQWIAQLEAKCQQAESQLSQKHDEIKDKDFELSRLQNSLKEAEKVLAIRRERKSRRNSTGSKMVTTNGYLDVNEPAKRRSERRRGISPVRPQSNYVSISENGPSLTVSAPQFHMTPVIEVPTVSVETEPLPQPSIQIGYASSAVNSEFESEDSDNDMSD
ncbi:cyclic nucleotide-gated cation channel alpha-3-like isoform X3 [Corticium candelabrum]|uniref:cyclic nucleotide-gated cation channel alpha-3-like isoform X3 n=1 Tax=Corticium candelabrum TaxID=121492 RepID=UPI002E256048|nr:cyclic nucleotide-gated cation channel alpha-3-like isoform X3 [Corticium candelabrum]